MTTHDINALLEQYNLAQYDSEDGFDEYYWHVAEEISQIFFCKHTIGLHDIVDALTDMLKLTEDDIKVDEIDDFVEDLVDIIKS